MNRFAWAACSVIIVLQATLLGFGLTRTDSSRSLGTPISPTFEVAIPLDLEGIAPFSNDIAREWRSGAQLVRASMQLDWPRDASVPEFTDLPRGGWIMLAYVADDELLTMRIDRGSGTIVETTISPLDAQTRTSYNASGLDLTIAATTSGTAMRAAETAYGQAFRSDCPEQRFTSWLSTARDVSTGERAWHIEYVQRVEGDTSSVSLDIDWETGQIENVAGEALACA